MVVMAVMAEALHLFSRYGQSPFGVKWFVGSLAGIMERRIVADAYARSIPEAAFLYLRARDEGHSGCAFQRLDRAV